MAKRTGYRPIICVSKCLGFAACRYDGTIVHDKFVRKLKKRVKIITCCPEFEIGLGVPRDPIRIVSVRGDHRLIQPATGLDITKRMEKKCGEILKALPAVDGFILKSRSPSCGLRDVKVYSAPYGAAHAGKGAGFFGRAVLKRYPHLPIDDDRRLKNSRCRERFLARLFGVKEKENASC